MLERWKDHLKKAKETYKQNKASYFHQAIIKYGTEAWDHVLLEVVNNLKEAEEAEIKWIANYKSNQKEYGYNLTTGGGFSVAVFNDEVKQKISNTVKTLMSEPQRKEAQSKKMKEYYKTHPNPFLGKKHSEESLKKMSQKSKKYHLHHPNFNKNRVISESTRNKMSQSAKKRCQDPNWKSPLKPLSREKIEEIAAKKRGVPIGKISKEQILEAAKTSKSNREIAKKLNCTPANISWLTKYLNFREECAAIISSNRPLTNYRKRRLRKLMEKQK